MLNPYRADISKQRVTSIYGMRSGVMHKGVDLVSDGDKTLVAIGSGKIATSTIVTNKSDLTWQWGNYVRLDLDTGERVYYCHMSQRNVVAGQRVNKGDVIGVEGTTGYSSGSHLHLEIRPKGTTSDAVNSAAFIGIENAVGRAKAVDCAAVVAKLAGFEKQTLDYFNAYAYKDDIWRKLYFELIYNRNVTATSNCRAFIQSKCGFSDATMKFIDSYKYADSFYEKLVNKVHGK